jgi:hypothetical protein
MLLSSCIHHALGINIQPGFRCVAGRAQRPMVIDCLLFGVRVFRVVGVQGGGGE